MSRGPDDYGPLVQLDADGPIQAGPLEPVVVGEFDFAAVTSRIALAMATPTAMIAPMND